MYIVRIPLNTPTGTLHASPTFNDLSDYIDAKLLGARIIGKWDRAVHRQGSAIVIRTSTELPESIVQWAIGATREFYPHLTLGDVVSEREASSAIGAALVGAASVAAAPGAPGAPGAGSAVAV